jgi:thymidylate kinase
MSSELTANVSGPDASPSDPDPGRPMVDNPRGRLLQSVFELMDAQGIPYCILHGHKEYPARVTSDVDCIIPAEFLPGGLARLLRANRDRLGATVVQWIQHESTAHYFILATDGVAGRWEFLAVDASSDYRGDGRVFYRGEEILASRCLDRGFWVPSPALEFGSYLVKKVAKRSLGEEHDRRLTELYNGDPAGCGREIARFWRGSSARLICDVAASGEWDVVRRLLPSLRRELLWPGTARELQSCLGYWRADASRRFRRYRVPTGVHVVLLGGDGAGKSATLPALADALSPVFRRVTSKHLAPALFNGTRGNTSAVSPHSRSPRSFIGSMAKAAAWALDYTIGYEIRVRPALARSTLVLFDRYMVDALVDPRRYRYGGPRWVLRLVWSIVPKPDLVILLDAPPEVLRARKQEVSFPETERQRHAYRELVQTLPNGYIVDAAQPLDDVVAAVATVVLGFLTSRIVRRLGEPEAARVAGQAGYATTLERRGEDAQHHAGGGGEGKPV